MKIMMANSKIKAKPITILRVIRNLVLDFILYFVIVYIKWESTLNMSHEHRWKDQMHYASLEEASKNVYEKQFTTVTTQKNVQNYYNEKCTYKVNTHCNLLYALNL